MAWFSELLLKSEPIDFLSSCQSHPKEKFTYVQYMREHSLSEEEGIKAIIGKPRGKDTTKVQSYLFSKDERRLETAPKSAHSQAGKPLILHHYRH